jgi:1-acyl-sn-glycerol-3-phosphate acyltransferase
MRLRSDHGAAAVANRSQAWFAFFAGVFTRSVRRNFHALRISRSCAPPADVPHLLIYCNHPSWWDAAVIVVLLAKLFPTRQGYAPIDESMITRYGFMPRIGAFGVAQNAARGAAQFLAVGSRILADRRNVLFVTAQGRFTDARQRPLRLAPGLSHLLDHVTTVNLVPLAIDYVFWTERKPELLLRFGAPIAGADMQKLPRAERTRRLEQALEQSMDALKAEAIQRDAAAFSTLLEGSAGVGGVYDLWRRSKAMFGGQPFKAAHGEQP